MKAGQLPINDGEVYIRCPECHRIGWTVDEPERPLPECPHCGVKAEQVGTEAAGDPDVRIIDGEPSDLSHHLTLDML